MKTLTLTPECYSEAEVKKEVVDENKEGSGPTTNQ